MSGLQDFIVSRTPHGWSTKPLWSLFRRRKRTGYPDEELLSVYRDYGVIPKSSRDDNFNKESEDLSSYQLVTEGSLVTNKMKAWQGSIAVSRYRGIVSPAYYVYEPISDECDQFLHYLLRSDPYIALYGRISKGVRVNQWDLEHEALRNVPMMLPDRETQKSIADFLDRETARIDQLIEKKKRLVDLLVDKESSELDQLFFRTGSPESISWKRFKIPKPRPKFKVYKLSYLCSLLRDGTHQPPPRVDQGIPLLSVRNIIDGDFVFREDDSHISDIDYNMLCRSFTVLEGDVLLAVVGATLGKVSVVGEMSPFHIQRSLAIMRPRTDLISSQFLSLYLKSGFFQRLLWENTSFSAQPGIYLSTLGSFPVVFPSPELQEQLLERFGSIAAKLQEARRRTRHSVDLLAEFRASLITAAVTGQVDVNEWGKRGQTDRRLDQIREEMAS